MFLTDLLFNSPRLRFSVLQQRAILLYAKEMKDQHVPTLYALKKVQQALMTVIGNPPTRCVSSLDNIYYINDLPKMFAKVSLFLGMWF